MLQGKEYKDEYQRLLYNFHLSNIHIMQWPFRIIGGLCSYFINDFHTVNYLSKNGVITIKMKGVFLHYKKFTMMDRVFKQIFAMRYIAMGLFVFLIAIGAATFLATFFAAGLLTFF